MHDKETLASLRRTVFSKLKANPCSLKLELALGQVGSSIKLSLQMTGLKELVLDLNL